MFGPMDPAAQAFMTAESRQTPMHVGSLQLFEPPEGAGAEWVRETYERFVQVDQIAPFFLKRPHRSVKTAGAWVWTPDDQFDLEYHVRHSALPGPGRIRELLEVIGRWHGTRLARERPLWEMHLVEGLDDGRIAVYTKLHHALVDGVSGMRLLQATLSDEPGERETPAPWAARDVTPEAESEHGDLVERLRHLPRDATRSALVVASEAAGLSGALARTLDRSLRNEAGPLALNAPRTILNQNITGARRFAAQQWPVERIRRVGKASGVTINDVVLAMCSGAMREYLQELDALVAQPLIAMVPVSLRPSEVDGASEVGGNAVGTIMVNLASHLEDPTKRLAAIHDSVTGGKQVLSTMSQTQIVAMTALGMGGLLWPMLGLANLTRPPFNVVISNIPGPPKPLYLSGARLTDMYPLSIPTHGLALNITCSSYDEMMGFGLVGCRRTVPKLQRLLTHLDHELARLEEAVGVA